MVKNLTLLSLLIFLGLIITTSGCASKTEPALDSSPAKVEDHYQELLAKDKHLFRQNKELRNQLLRLETERAEDKKLFEKKIRHLTKTIQLLELNFNQLKNRQVGNSKQAEKGNITPATVVSGSAGAQGTVETPSEKAATGIGDTSDHFVTPDDSKAINTIPLLSNDLKTVPLPIPVPENKSEEESRKASEESVFLTEESEQTWEDPDLRTPPNPIKLKTIPGAKRSYQKAFKTFSNREFSEAIKQFSDFLVRYPNDLDADNSQYWIGQAHYQNENYLEAENAFRKVLRDYEHKETKVGYKTPDAILMLGRLYMNRNKPIKGRYYFQQVIERFPTSRSAAKAKREIQSMKIF